MPLCPRRRWPIPALIATALLAVSPVAWADKYPASTAWRPLPAPDPRLGLRGQRATFRDRGIVVEIERLDASLRARFLASAGIGPADPFDRVVLDEEVITFLVRIDNGSSETVILRPQNFVLITRKPVSHATPCDFHCLYAVGQRAGYDDRGVRKLAAACFDASESIPVGGKLSKLLVFNRMPDAFKDFTLDLDWVSVGSEQLRFVLPYVAPEDEAEALRKLEKQSGQPAKGPSSAPGTAR